MQEFHESDAVPIMEFHDRATNAFASDKIYDSEVDQLKSFLRGKYFRELFRVGGDNLVRDERPSEPIPKWMLR